MRHARLFTSLFITFFTIIFLVGCAEDRSLSINGQNIIMVDEEVCLVLISKGLDKDAIWTSSDVAIATVDNGKVKGIAPGEVVITAKIGKYEDSIKITVIEQVKEKFVVVFKDRSGTIIKQEAVEKGKDATAPKLNEEEGYEFIGWDQDFTNVTKNLIVKAIYKKVCKIDYVLDNSIVEEELTFSSLEGEKVTLPKKAFKDQYMFLGWSLVKGGSEYITEIEAIDQDIIVYANFMSYQELLKIAAQELKETYNSNSLVEESLDLITKDELGITYEWVSSNPVILSNSGQLCRNYEKSSVTYEILLKLDKTELATSIELKVAGFKSLEKAISSSYLYRYYSSVKDEYFDCLDIINCAFIDADAEGNLSGSSFLAMCQKYIIPRAHEKGCYVVMSVSPESKWSSFAGNASSIENFANNVVELINKYGFDGIDIDWEYPASGQYTWFTNLVKAVREKVKANNAHHLVTAAIGGGKWQPPHYDLVNSEKYLDYINMMTYGMTSANGQYQNALFASRTKHNTQFNCGFTLSSCSIDESVKFYQSNYGISKNKIIAGVAYYGIRQSRTSVSNAFGSGGSIYYSSIIDLLNNPNYTYCYDETAQVPYLIKKDGLIFISYDNERSIKAKALYIIENNLAGMMHWESGCDTSGELLRAQAEGLKTK